MRNLRYTERYFYLGGDMASTSVAKPEVHAEEVAILVKNATNQIFAKNDKYFAGRDLAAVAA